MFCAITDSGFHAADYEWFPVANFAIFSGGHKLALCGFPAERECVILLIISNMTHSKIYRFMVSVCFCVVVLLPLYSQDGFYRLIELPVSFRAVFLIDIIVVGLVISLADVTGGQNSFEPGLLHLADGRKAMLQELVNEEAHPLLFAIKDNDWHKGFAQVQKLAKV